MSDKPPILFLHGAFGGPEVWTRFVAPWFAGARPPGGGAAALDAAGGAAGAAARLCGAGGGGGRRAGPRSGRRRW